MKRLLIVISFILIAVSLKSQVPEKFNFQGVLRNASDELIKNSNIGIRISLIEGSASGTEIYVETHAVQTNNFGQFAIQVGAGNEVSGDFSSIDWASGQVFIKTSVDENGGSDYSELNTVQLITVPYSLFSNASITSKYSIKADTANVAKRLDEDVLYFTDTDTLFAVKDREGNVVFAIFPDGAEIYVNETAKGKVGGFAISGRSPSKAGGVDILRVTVDSTRIYVNDTVTAKGKVGGFAISGRSPSKGISNEYLVITGDSTRIYVNDTSTVKGKVGGFAISGRSPSKGVTNDYLTVNRDSTRVYVTESTGKGKVGGFAISGRSPSKGVSRKFMDMTKENYFIGHESGQQIGLGIYNSTLGYQSGFSITDGESNSFIGYQSGYNNSIGNGNLFLGYQTGYSNDDGNYNSFLGYKAGYSNTDGLFNTFLGSYSGFSNQSGNNNTFVGDSAGYKNKGNSNSFFGTKTGLNTTTGIQNVFIGNMCGYNHTTGYSNVYIGNQAGYAYNSSYNVLIGNMAGYSNSGSSNVFIGFEAGRDNGTGGSNVIIGKESGKNNTTGSGNVFLGFQSGLYNSGGDNNVFIGNYAGFFNSTGRQNVYLGDWAAYESTKGWLNVAIGPKAGYKNDGIANIMIGTNAGYNDSTGLKNVYIGASAGYENVSGFKNIFIGNEAGYYSKSSEKLYIENSNADSLSALIYGDFDNDFVCINHSLGIGRMPGTSYALEVEGSAYKTDGSTLWTITSDKRIKTDIRDIENSFETILKLRPVKYKYTEEWKKKNPSLKDQYYYNFIAQDYQEVFPESVSKSGEYLDGDPNEILTINTQNAQIVTIKAVQDLIKENDKQQLEIENLKSENQELKQKLNEIIEMLSKE